MQYDCVFKDIVYHMLWHTMLYPNWVARVRTVECIVQANVVCSYHMISCAELFNYTYCLVTIVDYQE